MGLIKHMRENINDPSRPHTRTGLTLKYIKTPIKNMPKFVVDKLKRSEERKQALRTSDDADLEVSLTKTEVADLRMLRIVQKMLGGLRKQLANSSNTIPEVQAAAGRSLKHRIDLRATIQKPMRNVNARPLRRKSIETADSLRQAYHRMEKLLTATANDGRQMGNLLAGLVKIVGLQAGFPEQQVNSIVGSVTTAGPVPEPPLSELVVIEERKVK